jgi:hypothetical protein
MGNLGSSDGLEFMAIARDYMVHAYNTELCRFHGSIKLIPAWVQKA